jgi:hypothetical protein
MSSVCALPLELVAAAGAMHLVVPAILYFTTITTPSFRYQVIIQNTVIAVVFS